MLSLSTDHTFNEQCHASLEDSNRGLGLEFALFHAIYAALFKIGYGPIGLCLWLWLLLCLVYRCSGWWWAGVYRVVRKKLQFWPESNFDSRNAGLGLDHPLSAPLLMPWRPLILGSCPHPHPIPRVSTLTALRPERMMKRYVFAKSVIDQPGIKLTKYRFKMISALKA